MINSCLTADVNKACFKSALACTQRVVLASANTSHRAPAMLDEIPLARFCIFFILQIEKEKNKNRYKSGLRAHTRTPTH